ncbi:protein C10-like isoform X2 [Leguminivora glycinivorella]|uniref:protein C10-like isoform X2 n=1 Tax=Leguminivora glycinivorella TaxID=1035111 RepID=UPI0020108C5A|nr:protein C10-like isoform X2 [Leguminivora glycinivorella]XP_047995183.1 protein C10-like isoform X2 [Leguminivora glycinivorella]
MASPQNVSVDQIRQILTEIIDSLESPDYSCKLDEAKEAAGNEMLKMMQIVFPMVVQIEMETIKRHGFSGTREGIVQFTQLVRETESLDAEVSRLHNQIRSHYLPPVSISSTVDTSL